MSVSTDKPVANTVSIRKSDVPWQLRGSGAVLAVFLYLGIFTWFLWGSPSYLRLGVLDTIIAMLICIPIGWFAGGLYIAVTESILGETPNCSMGDEFAMRWSPENIGRSAKHAASVFLALAANIAANAAMKSLVSTGWPMFGSGYLGVLWAGLIWFTVPLWFRYARWYYSLPK